MVAELSARACICSEIHSRKAANLGPAYWAIISCHFCTPHSFLKTQLLMGTPLPLEVSQQPSDMSCPVPTCHQVHDIMYMTRETLPRLTMTVP